MKTTQRIRFKQSDLYKGIVWATPLGSVEFINEADFIICTVTKVNGKKIHFASTPKTMVTRINRYIKRGLK